MKIESIRWKSRFPNCGIPAENAYMEVEKIRSKYGGSLYAEDIVQEAKSEKHLLHPLFEWDDSVAANKHRMEQARCLLRSFDVIYKEAPKTKSRAYEVVTKKAPGNNETRTVWTTTEEAMKDPATRDAIIAEAIRQAMSWRRRFQGLRELQVVCEAIDRVVEEVGAA